MSRHSLLPYGAVLLALAAALLLPLSVLAQDGEGAITLLSFENETLGIRGVVPAGWEIARAGGLFVAPDQTTTLIYQVNASEPVSITLAQLAFDLRLPQTPASIGSHSSAAFTWDLYRFAATSQDAPDTTIQMDVAVTQSPAGSILVGVQTTGDDAQVHDTVFLPAVDAVTLLGDEPLGPPTLAPFTSSSLGIRGVAPIGWQEVSSGGVFVSEARSADLVYQVTPGATRRDLLQQLVSQFALAMEPQQTDSHESDSFTWSLYAFQSPSVTQQGVTVVTGAALAETSAGTVMVVLQALPEDYPALHESVLLPALDALILSAPDVEAITLVPFLSAELGLTGLAPAGWTEVQPGIYARGQNADDIATLIQQFVSGATSAQLTGILLQSLGLTALPPRTGTHQSASYAWNLYRVTLEVSDLTVDVDIALAETATGTVVVLLQTLAEDYPALHEGVFLPALDALAPLTASGAPSSGGLPPYADRDAFAEEEVSFGLAGWELTGTLTRPTGEGPFPAVVLVSGSGPGDRDTTLGTNKMFRDLAWGLAAQGIAVLRYDRRTFLHAEAFYALVDRTVDDEITDDALAAVAFLQGQEGIDPARIVVAGHGLGGVMALRVGAAEPDLAGLILMAASARPHNVVLAEQVGYLAALSDRQLGEALENLGVLAAQLTAIRLGEDAAHVFSDPGDASYWSSLLAFDHLAAAQALDMPLLILHGERDYQVTMADFALWQDRLAGRGNVTFRSYPALAHTFMPLGDLSRTVIPADYMEEGFVDETVIDDIAAWVLAR